MSSTPETATAVEPRRSRKVGTVISNKMEKTVVVEVSRLVKHTRYGRYQRKSARFLADDLEGYRLLRAPVIGEKDLTHASFAEALADLVPVVDHGPVRDRRGRAALRLGHCVTSSFAAFSACSSRVVHSGR